VRDPTMPLTSLPTLQDCIRAYNRGNATPVQRLIYHFEPRDEENAPDEIDMFRMLLYRIVKGEK